MAATYRDECVRDQGGIVLGWLTKLGLFLAVVAVICFDLISVGTAKMSVQDQGASAALTASDVYQRSHDVKQAMESAEQSVTASNPANVLDVNAFHVDPDGTVHVRVSRQAPTLIAHYIRKLRELSDVSADSEGRSTA